MASNPLCAHGPRTCLNQHELIRKYRCDDCGAVMMCACDKAFGERFLAHQLSEGTELETQRRVPVTLGFVRSTCSECRGLQADPAPAAAIHGRTSKIRRYYWREIYFVERTEQADWADAHLDASDEERQQAFRAIEQRVLEDIKRVHATSPKYVFTDLSQAQVIERYAVKVEALSATYKSGGGKGSQIAVNGDIISPEAFATRHYEALGWSVLQLESVPFHALFGVMMWMLIQDSNDPLSRVVGFGDRAVYEETRGKSMIWTPLPEDFGSKGYGTRRDDAIRTHLGRLVPGCEELLWTFDYWRPYSENLRQYLWAHRAEDVDRARRLIEILPPGTIIAILGYLAENYWNHFLGWPDLLLHRGDAFELVEVKSSSDRLSEDQKRWIADNHDTLKLPFRIAKIHKLGTT
jgi:hypothetical protein